MSDEVKTTNRRHEYKVALKKQRARRRLLKFGIPIVVVALIGAGIALIVTRDKEDTNIDGVQTFANLGRNHVQTPVTYPQNPPTGGDHSATWLNCGAYNTQVANENAVHALEHGAVWITYQPNLDSDQVNKLRSLTRKYSYLVVSPYEGDPSPVVASAWGLQLQLPSANDPRLEKFIKKYMQGPQTPEPGAACTGGTGRPS